jgi:hypothetical protein
VVFGCCKDIIKGNILTYCFKFFVLIKVQPDLKSSYPHRGRGGLNYLEAENANAKLSTYESRGTFANNLLSDIGMNLKIPNNHLMMMKVSFSYF